MIFLLHITGLLLRNRHSLRTERVFWRAAGWDICFCRLSRRVNGSFLVQFPGRCFSARVLSGSTLTIIYLAAGIQVVLVLS